MNDKHLSKELLEWREKNKQLLEEKIKNPRPWQEILSDIKKWCDQADSVTKGQMSPMSGKRPKTKKTRRKIMSNNYSGI